MKTDHIINLYSEFIIMSSRSIGGRASNEKQRYRSKAVKMKDMMESSSEREKTPTDNTERICKSCGFKAWYPFKRCPICGEEQT